QDGLGLDLPGLSAVVVGAGGAARAVVAALGRHRAGRVVVAARRRAPADAVAALAHGHGRAVPMGSKAAGTAVASADLVVNATPVGMAADELPAHLIGELHSGQAAMDLVYSPPETPFLRAARGAGARTTGGLGMLVHQAGLAFTLFTGQPAPLEAMSAAAVAELSRRHAGGFTDLA